MEYLDYISAFLNVLFGGGCLVAIFTIRAQRKKANAEAEALEQTNNENLLQMYNEYFVDPLKKDNNELRAQLAEIKGKMDAMQIELQRLNIAIESVSLCPHRGDCPILDRLQDSDN